MKKIKTVYFHALRAHEHDQYFIRFRALLDVSPQVKEVVSEQYPVFVERLKREMALLNRMRKSDYTVQIAEADRRIDRCLTGIYEMVAAFTHHFDPAVEEAAASLYNRVKAFGDIRRQNYSSSVTFLTFLIADLRSPEYSAKAALIGLTPWVDELAAARTAFDELFDLRSSERAQKPQGQLRAARRDVEAAYYPMVERITAASLFSDAPEAFDGFISRLNVNVDEFMELLHRHARKDLGAGGHTIIEAIAPQPATGRPITVVPAVYYRDVVENDEQGVALALGRDFTITYRYNVRPGMAEVTIRGKGEYKGKKTATFMIEP
ncbi:MAG: DUF6261 family protein [Prevotellaceae bacterium]|jgi:hypothetical protein|nr:DUF6261 family protein [Prevotellaceae bacterium]